MKNKAKPPAMYYTVGVRFLDSVTIGKVFTYRVHSRSKVSLGQELVADTPRGPAIAVVVRIDKTRQDTGPYDYKYLEKKVAKL
jgi:hypothetical protein